MNKNAIKKFAIDARNKLIASVTDKAGMLGITPDNCSEAITKGADFEVYKTAAGTEVTLNKKQCEQRRKLVAKIYEKGFESVVEEVAYTWFNRICAIRFMEVNDYMYPVRVRVLSSEKEGKNEPDVVTMAPDIDWNFTDKEREEIIDDKMNGSQDALFRKLFLKQCNLLHEVLPGLFEGNEDYMEPLLTLSYTDKDGIIYHLIHDIEEDDFNVEKEGQVEIIGWLYQYYISEKHDEIINIYKGTIKKDDIPAATQLFTTDWVVRYMVDNSLGRYWIERNPQSKLAEKLEFYVTPKNGEIQYVDEKISPTDLTFFDPCMGSGHILVYAFDVLMEIYREGGYSVRDAALNIVENNIFGMDIDKRAYQLAYFAVMMKARSYNRRALTQGIKNNLTVVEESNSIDRFECDGLTNNKEKNKIGDYLVKAYKDAREIGTLQTVVLNTKEDRYEATFSNLGIKNIPISADYVKDFDRLLCGGIWCILQLDYEFIEEDKKNTQPIRIRKLTPIQMPHVDMDEVKNGRKAFTKEEWMDILLRSTGMEPDKLSDRAKWLLILKDNSVVLTGQNKKKNDVVINKQPLAKDALNLVDMAGTYCAADKNTDGSRFNILSAVISFSTAVNAQNNNIDDVGIITPYAAQVRLIRAMLRDYYAKDIPSIRCATVHQFQGSESDVIVFDAVESYPKGAVGYLMGKEPNQVTRLINVAITRGKGKVIVVANARFWENIFKGRNHVFYRLLQHIKNKNHQVVEYQDKTLQPYVESINPGKVVDIFVDEQDAIAKFEQDMLKAKWKVVISLPSGALRETENQKIIDYLIHLGMYEIVVLCVMNTSIKKNECKEQIKRN